MHLMARILMDRVCFEPFQRACRLFADKLAGCEAFESLKSSAEVVGADETHEVISQLVVVIGLKVFDGRLLDLRSMPSTYLFHPGWSHSPSAVSVFHGGLGSDQVAGRERDMLIALHIKAATTSKVRAAIQASDESAWLLIITDY